ncbi:MAG: type I-E CRISPR-associated protein Cse1/CasA [Actinomycetota bacterium]|nr:type I-E CRISPR-associated protein Cse1/CasA [Actinomycetota bacterium]MDQ2958884.1 type I-E CRISPR-associated protein Cse1/CasA [Actinomycetota bacterium]
MTGDGFDLTRQPWILVRTLDGELRELSLTDTLTSAHELAGIVGEIPTQTFAITRLLLAILHCALDGPTDIPGWVALWEQPELPAEPITSYLSDYSDRFDLLHPTQPFFQVASLRTSKDETFGLERLIADAPTGRPYFTTRLGAALESIEFAEAARWLVHCQAFDPSGIKSGAVSDPRVKGGRGYPIGVAWSGLIGGILCEGQTLRETLLLNLIARPDDSGTAMDQPVWERPPQTARPDALEGRPPTGPLDLYTWQARRIRLVPKGNQVTGVLVCNGDKLTPQNLNQLEPMTVWRRSANQEKQLGETPVYMPRVHDPERSLWQGIEALLPSQAGSRQGNEAAAALTPGCLSWIGQLHYYGALPAEYAVRTRAIGMYYINQSALVGEIVDDSLSMSVLLLSESGAPLAAQIAEGAAKLEEGVRSLANLAGKLAVAAGGDSKPPQDPAKAVGFAAVDGEFRRWLSDLGPGSDPLTAQAALYATARSILLELGRELVRSASPQAWSGRKVDKNIVCTATADNWFQRDIYRLFPVVTAESQGVA